jgi:tetracycline 7-halogenase / FADH2 O2-dependent halogenase
VPDYDLAVVGSGFGGAVLAMIATRLGRRVALLERGRHPRFAVGESASPLAGVLIEQLAARYDLPRLAPLATYGAWQRAYPEIGCGLKRGFTYFRHERDLPYRTAAGRSNQLLVAASPNDWLSDTHWLRADVDHFLVREAIALGVYYVDQIDLQAIEWTPDGSPRLGGTRLGHPVRIDATRVVDASGPNGFLSRALGLANRGFDGYPRTQALYSHFTGVARCDGMPEYGVERPPSAPSLQGGDGATPYPSDDAALHHVFDGGWMWVLRFGNGVTSAGVAVTDECAAEHRLADGAPAWARLLARYPSIAAQFAAATPIREFTYMPRLAWRTPAAAGPGWAMLPSAAAFVDPLFSTGIPLTLLGVERLAAIFEQPHGRGVPPPAGPYADYSDRTLADADLTARFIGGCYAAFPRFAQFTAYSMCYFAAASFSELARRIDGARRPSRFLCGDDDMFRAAIERLSPARQGGDDGYAARIAAAIDHRNIAGLCDPAKRNWYGVDLDDAVRGAHKLGVTADAVERANCLSSSSLPG